MTKKQLNEILEMDFEESYKFFLHNFPIYKNFENLSKNKRQIFFDLGKLGQIGFEKINGVVETYTFKEKHSFDFSKFPKKEYSFTILMYML